MTGLSRVSRQTVITVFVWVAILICGYAILEDKLSQWDFEVYYAAAHALVAGKSPYAPIHPHPGLQGELTFQYPPLAIYLFLWTTLLGLGSAKNVWLASKLIAFVLLIRIWHKDFERLSVDWPICIFIALGFNAAILRDLTCGNISAFEQLCLWFAFGLLVRGRPYAAAFTLAFVAQFKLLPVAFIGLVPCCTSQNRWRPFFAGIAAFLGLLILNMAIAPGLTHDYLGLFADTNDRMDDRGINNPSSLSLFRDVIDLTAYAPGLPYNRVSGTIAYITYLVALILILIRSGWHQRAKFRHCDPRLLIYLGCAIYTILMPRMKDYSYILMLLPALFVSRDLCVRHVKPEYVALAAGFMLCAQPQQTNVPGLMGLVYMLQAYLPLFSSSMILFYILNTLLRTEGRGEGSFTSQRISGVPALE
jgi:hypothetical protein